MLLLVSILLMLMGLYIAGACGGAEEHSMGFLTFITIACHVSVTIWVRDTTEKMSEKTPTLEKQREDRQIVTKST